MAAKICQVGNFLAAIFFLTLPKLVLGNHSLSTFSQLIGMLEQLIAGSCSGRRVTAMSSTGRQLRCCRCNGVAKCLWWVVSSCNLY